MVSYGEPVPTDGEIDREAITKTLEGTVHQLTAKALLGARSRRMWRNELGKLK